MEILADVAGDAPAAAATNGGEGAAAPKRKNRSKLEVKQDKLRREREKLALLEAGVSGMVAAAKATRLGATKDKREAEAKIAQAKADAQKEVVKAVEREVDVLEAAAALKKRAQDQKEADAAQKADESKIMSTDGLKQLVTIRLAAPLPTSPSRRTRNTTALQRASRGTHDTAAVGRATSDSGEPPRA